MRTHTTGFLLGLLAIGACTPAGVPVKQEEVKQIETKVETKVETNSVELKKVEEPEQTPPLVDDGPVKPEGLPAGQFMFVFRGEVAIETAAQGSWGTGKVRPKETKEGFEGRRDVDVAKLPAALRELDGAAVTMYGARGKVCEAKLKGLTLYGLSERGDEEASTEELPSMPVLMAGLGEAKGTCKDALWARRSDLPAPVIYTSGKADAAMVTKARAETQKLAAYATMKADFAEAEAELPGKLKWDKFAAKQFRVTVWSELGGARRLVTTELGDAEWVKCEAYFSQSVAAVFAVEGAGLKLLSEDGAWQPSAMVDLDGDGAAELLMTPPAGLGGILLAAARKQGEVVDELRFPSEGLGGCADEGDGGMADEP